MRRRICLGTFSSAHGVKGDFKVRSFTQQPADIATYGPLESEDGKLILTLTLVREPKPGVFIARAPEIQTREQAEQWRGTKLFVERDRLPPPDEDEFYYEDLVGLNVQTSEGEPYGKVKAILNHGAGDIIEIFQLPGSNKTNLIPFTKEAVPAIDFERKLITVILPEEDGELPPQEEAPA